MDTKTLLTKIKNAPIDIQNTTTKTLQKTKDKDIKIFVTKTIHLFNANKFQNAMKQSVIAKEVLWEALHSVKWNEVPDFLRDLFRIVSIYFVSSYSATVLMSGHFNKNNILSTFCKNSLYLIDLAIMMGADSMRKNVYQIAQLITNLYKTTKLEKISLKSAINDKISLKSSKIDKISLKSSKIDKIGKISQKSSKIDKIFKLKNTKNLTKKLSPKYDVPISMTTFKKHLDTKTPFVLKNFAYNWPCVDLNSKRCWAKIYPILDVAGLRTVPIEIGKNYLSENWSTKLCRFDKFVEQYVLNDNSDKKGYLAQHNLFEQIPELRRDFVVPDYCYLGENPSLVAENIWFGPKETVSPLHQDPKHNLFAQIAGHKYVRLYSDNEDNIYPRSDNLHKNSSKVLNVFDWDKKRFPNFEKATFFEVILSPGDLLFIPAKWWHYVESLSASINISFWFD